MLGINFVMNEDPLLLGELRTFFGDRTSHPRNICSLETYSLNNVSGSFFISLVPSSSSSTGNHCIT